MEDHKSKIRKDTLDKTIETINQMKASSGRKSAGSSAVSYMQKKNSYQQITRTKSSTGMAPTKKPQTVTPSHSGLQTQRSNNNLSKI